MVLSFVLGLEKRQSLGSEKHNCAICVSAGYDLIPTIPFGLLAWVQEPRGKESEEEIQGW